MADYRETLIYDADINRVITKLRLMSTATGRVATDHVTHAGRSSRAWSGFRTVAAGAVTALKYAAIGAGVAAAGLGAWGLTAAANFQQTRIAFEGILGSGERAESFLNRLQQFAAGTPFEFPELARSAQQLLGVGFAARDVIPTLTNIGNVTAALGVGSEGIDGIVRALGQMKGKGRASAEELQQISEAVPGFSAIEAVATSMGISVEEAYDRMAAGAIPADAAIAAVLGGMERFPGAAGAMERQSQTLNGVISTLKDTVTMALVDGIEPFLPAISSGIAQATPMIKSGISQMIGAFSSMASWVQAHWPEIRAHIDEFVAWYQTDAAPVVEEAGRRLVAGFEAVVGWVRDHWPEIRETAIEVLTTVQSVIVDVTGAITTIWNNFGDNMIRRWRDLWPIVRQVVSGAMEYVRSIIQVVSAAISGDWSTVWEGVKGVWRGLWTAAVGVLRAAWNAIVGILDISWEIVRAVVAAGVEAVLRFVGSLPGRIRSALAALPGLLVSAGRAMLTGLLNGAQAAWGFAANWLTGLPDAATSKVGSLLRTLYSAGRDLVQGLWDGIRSLWDDVTGWLGGAAGDLAGAVRGALDINSPSRVFMQIGMDSVEGLRRGLAAPLPALYSDAGAMAARLASSSATSTTTNNSSARVIIVRSEEEALEHLDPWARPAARGFLLGRSG